MFDSFSEGHVYFGRALLALSAVIVLATLLHVI